MSRLTALSDGLLTVAATDSSPLPLEIADVDIGQLLRDVAHRFSTRAAAQGLRIDVRTDGSRLTVSGDPARLDQAVGNLVDNALRHGGTDVVLHATGEPRGVIIRVSDRGPGLSADLRPRALDPFSRDARSRPGRGHGLGLAIVDAIVTAHGGATAIDPHSHSDGTEVTVALPTRPGLDSMTRPS